MPTDTTKDGTTPVDGALIAARILRRLPSSQRTRILSEMRAQDATLATAVQERVYNITELSMLSPKSTQTLVREVEHSDLVLSLKAAPSEVQRQLLESMSERKREMVAEDTQVITTESKNIKEAQWRLLEKLEELKERGLINEAKTRILA